MKKNSVLIGVVLLSILLSSAALVIVFTTKGDTIVYVDAQRLISEFKGTQEARKEFEAKVRTWQANLDTLQLETQEAIKEYESNVSKLSSKEKELSERLINSKQQQYTNYQQVISERVKQEDQQVTMNILTKIDGFIKKYGKEKGYPIILAATQYGNIVYAEDGKDITEEVLLKLNNEFPQ